MKRKKLSILILFMILVIVSVSTAFVACNDNTSSDQTAEALEPTEGLLISNSDFKVIGTTGSYPHTRRSTPPTVRSGTMTAARTRAARPCMNVSSPADTSPTRRTRSTTSS